MALPSEEDALFGGDADDEGEVDRIRASSAAAAAEARSAAVSQPLFTSYPLLTSALAFFLCDLC